MIKSLDNLFDGNPREPHLRVAVTPYCNFKCKYCKPGGEGCPPNGKLMTLEEIIKTIDLASKEGFKKIKFTGGEPLLRKEIVELIKKTKELNSVNEVGLVTNGSFLGKYAIQLKNAGLDRIAVSLDGGNYELFQEIAGNDCFYDVLEGIQAAKSADIPITINTVLMNSNKEGIKEIIDIAQKEKTKLKLIDYMNLGNFGLWEQEYISPIEFMFKFNDEIEETKWSYSFGGLGTPLATYKLKNNVEIRVKDASIGTNYHKTCKSCKNYPCQDAVVALRLTHDGKLKRCLIRDDNLIDVLDPLRKGDFKTVSRHFSEMYSLFVQTEFYPNAWNYTIERRLNHNDNQKTA